MRKTFLLILISFLFSSCEFMLEPNSPSVYYRPYNYGWYAPRVYVYPYNYYPYYGPRFDYRYNYPRYRGHH